MRDQARVSQQMALGKVLSGTPQSDRPACLSSSREGRAQPAVDHTEAPASCCCLAAHAPLILIRNSDPHLWMSAGDVLADVACCISEALVHTSLLELSQQPFAQPQQPLSGRDVPLGCCFWLHYLICRNIKVTNNWTNLMKGVASYPQHHLSDGNTAPGCNIKEHYEGAEQAAKGDHRQLT